jgi:hypothetical protein
MASAKQTLDKASGHFKRPKTAIARERAEAAAKAAEKPKKVRRAY